MGIEKAAVLGLSVSSGNVADAASDLKKLATEAVNAGKSADALGESVKKTDGPLRNAKGQFVKTGQAAQEAAGGVDLLSGSMLKSIAGMVAATAAANKVHQAFAYSSQASREFGQSISDLSAITGAVGQDLEFYRQTAMEMGATTTLSATQAAEAIKLLASAKPDLLSSKEALSSVTREAVALAEAAGIDMPTAATALGNSLNQFGAGADQAARFVNVLAAGAKYGSSEIFETSEALKDAGVAAATASISFEQTNAMIQLLAKSGIKGSVAGTQLKNMFLILDTAANEKFRPSLVGIEAALENLDKANLSTSDMVKLFGRETYAAAAAVLKMRGDLGGLIENLTGTETAYEQAAIRTANFNGEIKAMDSALEALGITMGDKVNEAMRPLVRLTTDLALGMNKLIVENDPTSWANRQVNANDQIRGAMEDVRKAEADLTRAKQDGMGTNYGYARSADTVANAEASLTAAKKRLSDAQQSLVIQTREVNGELPLIAANLQKTEVYVSNLADGFQRLGAGFSALGALDGAAKKLHNLSGDFSLDFQFSEAGSKINQTYEDRIRLANAVGNVERANIMAEIAARDAGIKSQVEINKLKQQQLELLNAEDAAQKRAADARKAGKVDNKAEREAEKLAALRESARQRLEQIEMDSTTELGRLNIKYDKELNQLKTFLEKKAITEEQYATAAETLAEQRDRTIAERKKAFQESTLSGFEAKPQTFDAKLEKLNEEFEARRQLTLQNEFLLETEKTALIETLENERLIKQKALQDQYTSQQLLGYSSMFDSMSGVAKSFLGEQSGVYKALFALSKGFALADAIVKIQSAIATASTAGPFPANLASISGTIAATGSILSTISGTQFSGAYDKGGAIPAGKIGLVGEVGAEIVQGPANVMSRADTAEAIRKGTDPTRGGGGERSQAQSMNMTIANFVDPDMFESFLTSRSGDAIFKNYLTNSASEVKAILGVA